VATHKSEQNGEKVRQ